MATTGGGDEFSSGCGEAEEEKRNSSLFVTRACKSCGRVEDLVKKRSVKSGRRSTEAQSFETQRHIAIDFNGSLEKMSTITSVRIGDAELLSLPLSEVFDSVLRWESQETLRVCCVSMAVA